MAGRTPTSIIVTLAFAAFVAYQSGCSTPDDGQVEALLTLAPDLPPELARHLVSSDDSTMFAYARSVGRPVFSGQHSYLLSRLDCSSLDSYVSSSSVLYPAMKRTRETFHLVFHNQEPQHFALYDLPPEHGLIAVGLMNERTALINDSGVPYDQKISRLEYLVESFTGYGLDGQATISLTLIAEVAGRNGDTERFIEFSHVALAAARASHRRSLTCQIMGTLGNHFKNTGAVDSMYVYWDAVLEQSRRYGLPSQEARIATFFAAYYEDAGHLALAQDYHNLAIDIVREGATGRIGLRYLVDALEFHADLGAWEIVGRNLPRAKRMEHASGYVASEFDDLHRVSLRVVEARYLMAKGRVSEGDSVFADCRRKNRGTFYTEHYTRILRYWAEGLLQNGRPSHAIPIIDEGVQFTRGDNQTESHMRFLIMRAKTAIDVGDLVTAESALGDFDRSFAGDEEDLRYEWIVSALLRARIEKQRGSTTAVLDWLETAVERFVESVQRVDASVHGYLWVGRCDELRRELHVALQDHPKLGYGFELFWRDAFGLLGAAGRGGAREAGTAEYDGGRGAAPSQRPLFGWLASYADRAGRSIARHGATHAVFHSINGEVWRWTCSRGAFRRDILETPAERLEEVAKRAWLGMSQDPLAGDALPDAGLVDDLSALAASLLPPEVLRAPQSENRPLFFVTADGFIGRLPFEALNIGNAGDYEPLLASFDVGYIRRLRETPVNPPANPGLVIANTSSGRPGRDVCSAPLTEVIGEVKKVAGWFPGSEILVNETATKENVLSLWRGASFLYLATHLVEDPDVPYLVLIPLAPADNSDDPTTSCLDMADIRDADFSRCNAVVLNQCSSGKPYLGARNSSPGLASAFLDSGAATVVQTLWNVRDDDAGAFMPSIIADLESSSLALVRALCRAKRARMNQETGVRHPYLWAPYTIQMGRL